MQEVTKVMQSSQMFFTPGIFRAMQNDYKVGRKNSQTRKRAISTISGGYNIPDIEAEGILSGTIPVTIDDDAGTVSYITKA